MGSGSSSGYNRPSGTVQPQNSGRHGSFGGNQRAVSHSRSFSDASPPRFDSNSEAVNRSGSMSIGSMIGGGVRGQTLKEHRRFGTVSVKIAATPPTITGTNARNNSIIHHTVTPRGAILYGTLCSPCVMQKALQSSGFPILPPAEITLADTRAHKLLIAHCQNRENNQQSDGWYAIPYPESFSRHSGSCLILGDRTVTSNPLPIKTGDCFRLGSVGLVVSEMRQGGEGHEETRIDARALQFLKDESVAFETQEYMAALATDEKERETELFRGEQSQSPQQMERSLDSDMPNSPDSTGQSPTWVNKDRSGIANGERFICYMCYETHNTADDALVAPCECKGDTRYLHVQCLQKWYHSSMNSAQTQVIRTTGNGAPACKICGAAYKTTFRKPDGKKASLLEMDSNCPYLSLVVVTRHDTNPGLFNTKFRLNFGRTANNTAQTEEEANSIIIGRSSSCNMILDYRTVSTIHAKIHFQDGKFFLSDKRSSNGTMIYLQDPIPLPYMVPMKFRMGRTTLTLQAKKSWSSTVRGILGGNLRTENGAYPSASDIFGALVDSGSNKDSGTGPNPVDNENIALNRSMSAKTINDGGSVDGGNDANERILADEDNNQGFTHASHGHNHSSNSSSRLGHRPSSSLRNSQLLMSMHNGVVSGTGSNPIDTNHHNAHVAAAAGVPSMAAATRDMDMDDEELQLAIQQSILVQEAQQQQRRLSASVGAAPDAGQSGLSAFAEEDGYLDGEDSSERQRSMSGAAPVATDIFAQIYDSKNVPPSSSQSMHGVSSRGNYPAQGSRSSISDNPNNSSLQSTPFFVDEFLSLPAAGAFGMIGSSSSAAMSSRRSGIGATLITPNSNSNSNSNANDGSAISVATANGVGGVAEDAALSLSMPSSRRGSPPTVRVDGVSPGRTSTIYLAESTAD